MFILRTHYLDKNIFENTKSHFNSQLCTYTSSYLVFTILYFQMYKTSEIKIISE